MSVSCRTLIETKKRKENFDCGVDMVHLGVPRWTISVDLFGHTIIEDTKLGEKFDCGVSTGAYWACQDGAQEMFVYCRTLFVDTKFGEHFGFGVGRRHSGRCKMAHNKYLYLIRRWLQKQNSRRILVVV